MQSDPAASSATQLCTPAALSKGQAAARFGPRGRTRAGHWGYHRQSHQREKASHFSCLQTLLIMDAWLENIHYALLL